MLGLREFCARIKQNSAPKTDSKGLTVGKDKTGAYMTLPSPNVQNADLISFAVHALGPDDGIYPEAEFALLKNLPA
ncbi:hypothetical protein TNCT_431921 [Trichonephila clavata]|uniref:Uncharacterized protein n=1 Tax=Trichonephila clavata TaxID=2740835 RepID=A0A8X6IYN5_TRICU|nr:hypothetical protein TNCT_431921 [Trichonephila clavata]